MIEDIGLWILVVGIITLAILFFCVIIKNKYKELELRKELTEIVQKRKGRLHTNESTNSI